MTSENPSEPGDGEAPTASFEEWLRSQAESQGISEEELFENLVSSYWTLNEMMELLDGSNKAEKGAFGVARPEHIASGGSRSERRRVEDVEEDATDEKPTADERERGEKREREERDDVAERVDELSDRVEQLQSKVEEEAERGRSLDGATEAIADRLTELESELDEERTDREAKQQELAAKQQQISSWLDSEFDNLGTILEYLVTKTDELESEVSDVESNSEEALARLRQERDAIESIKRDAAAADVRTAECESCGSDIHIDLLERPYCPACESTLTGIEEHTKWLFFSEALATTGAGRSAASAAGSQTHERTPTDAREPKSRTASTSPDSAASESRESPVPTDLIGSGSPFDEQTGGDDDPGAGLGAGAGTSESETATTETSGDGSDILSEFDSVGADDEDDSVGADDEGDSATDTPFEFGKQSERPSWSEKQE